MAKSSAGKSASKKSAPAKSGGSKSSGASSASKSSSNNNRGGSDASRGAASKAAAQKKAASKTADSKSGKVKAKSDAAAGLRELFIDELKDIYWAEKALTKALPKMAKNATDASLKTALTDHLAQTQNQISRLEQVFASLGEKAVAKKCEAMAGLVKEGGEIMEGTEAGVVRDAGIISAGQKVEHYEIATYGTLCAFAKTLGEDEAGSLLMETLEEEKAADSKLSDIAENSVNLQAAGEDDDEDDDKEDNGSDTKDGNSKSSKNGSNAGRRGGKNSKGKSSGSDDDDDNDA